MKKSKKEGEMGEEIKIWWVRRGVVFNDSIFNEVRFKTPQNQYTLQIGYTQIPKDEYKIEVIGDITEDDFYYYVPFVCLLRNDVLIEYYDQQKTFEELIASFISMWPELEEVCKQINIENLLII